MQFCKPEVGKTYTVSTGIHVTIIGKSTFYPNTWIGESRSGEILHYDENGRCNDGLKSLIKEYVPPISKSTVVGLWAHLTAGNIFCSMQDHSYDHNMKLLGSVKVNVTEGQFAE